MRDKHVDDVSLHTHTHTHIGTVIFAICYSCIVILGVELLLVYITRNVYFFDRCIFTGHYETFKPMASINHFVIRVYSV